MQDSAGYGTIIRQEISEHSARVALTMGDAARVFRWIVVIVRDVLVNQWLLYDYHYKYVTKIC